MKKTKKRLLLISGVLVALLMIVGIGFYIKINSLMKDFSTLKTGEVIEGIYAIHDSYVNMYLIKDSNQYIAIDAGNDKENIAKGLKELK